MDKRNRVGFVRLLILLVLAVSVIVVCGDREEGSTSEGEPTDSMLIADMMRSTLMRWKYMDKVALYDTEFEYIQDEYTLDEYLKHERIRQAFVDSLVDFWVEGITFYGRDSALVKDVLVWCGPSGDTLVMPNHDMVYYHRGRWIRPTLGTSVGQLQYEELIRQADSAASAEEAEGYNY